MPPAQPMKENKVKHEKARKLREEGKTLERIAELIGVSSRQIHEWVKDITSPRISRIPRPENREKYEKARKFREEGKTLKSIAAEIKISPSQVFQWVTGIKPPLRIAGKPFPKNQEKYEKARKLREEGKTIKVIAEKVGIHKTSIQKWVADIKPPPRYHSLSDINEADRSANCIICGPTTIRARSSNAWQCGKASNKRYKNRSQHLYQKILGFLDDKECMDCGENNIIVLEFDHVRGEKRENVVTMANKGHSWETIQKEIRKCDIVCSNCHQIREAVRRKNHRYLWMIKKAS